MSFKGYNCKSRECYPVTEHAHITCDKANFRAGLQVE